MWYGDTENGQTAEYESSMEKQQGKTALKTKNGEN